MKLYQSQIKQLLTLITKGQIKALLLYGPDKGYIDKICMEIMREFDLLKTNLEYQEIDANNLGTMLNSHNFYGKRELIKIRSTTSSIDKSIKTLLGKSCLHFVVFIADELTPSSTIRKFFETEDYLASIACYYDDEQKISKMIFDRCAKEGKTISSDALAYCKSHLKGDHQLVCSEIDKLIHYVSGREHITLDDARLVLSAEYLANSDELCIYFAKKEFSNFLHEYAKLKQHNINDVLIIRALIRYYINLYITVSQINKGDNLETIISKLSPPIFYKYVNDFKTIASNTSVDQCIKLLSLLQQAEVDYKQNPDGFDLYSCLT